MNLPEKTIDELRTSLSQVAVPPSASQAAEKLVARGLLSREDGDTLARFDAIIEAMFLMMCADLSVRREELDLIWDTVRDLTGKPLEGEAVKELVTFYRTRLKDEGWDARVAKVGERLVEHRDHAEGAFALAAAVAMADEDVSLEENALTDKLAVKLGIDDSRACEILSSLKES